MDHYSSNQGGGVGQFNRLIKNRIVIGSIAAAFVLAVATALLVLASIAGWPQQLFRFVQPDTEPLADEFNLAGTASFDKSSYLIGELATYRVRLSWREAAVTPDLEAFKNGIGFFPFNRREIRESEQGPANGVSVYELEFRLQAVDVEPTRSYQLAPPTVYYTATDDAARELQSFRIEAPVIHIGAYYPANVAKLALLDYKGRIDDPLGLRQLLMAGSGLMLLLIAAGLLWHFGRVRKLESLGEPERLWHHYRGLDRKSMHNREYLDQCERIFTGLLRFRLNVSPVLFWFGRDPDTTEWKEILHRARELFYLNYLPAEPHAATVDQISRILDDMFARLTEEESLIREQQPMFYQRVASQFGVAGTSGIIISMALVALTLAVLPQFWSSRDVAEYNNAISMLQGNDSVQDIYEHFSKLPERITDPRIKAAALFNSGILAIRPELAELEAAQQEALLEVMFQQHKVFLDALLHSLTMEDPFLLVAILRDSVRFLTISVASLKAATRIRPDDEDIRRNLELVQKRRNAYAETIQEVLQGGEDATDAGELQRQTVMDLEVLLQTEMPDKYAEFEAAKNNKDYFILEGF